MSCSSSGGRFKMSFRKEVSCQEAGIHIRVSAAVGFVEDILAFENFKGMMKVYICRCR